MATFIDESDEEQTEKQPQEEQAVQETEELEELEQAEEPVEEDEDLPEKYRGKSKADIVRMHQESEKLVGRQGSEMGELRKILNEFRETQTVQKQAPEVEEEEVDLLEDPNKFFDSRFNKQLSKHPKFQELERLTKQLKAQEALSKLQQTHPDFASIVNDEKFGEWVKASKVRTKLLVQADQEYDFDAADELLSVWKERNQVFSKKQEESQQQRKQAIKTAATGSATGSAEPRSKKIYLAKDLEKLRMTDPDRYMSDAVQAEIKLAYTEGRVKY